MEQRDFWLNVFKDKYFNKREAKALDNGVRPDTYLSMTDEKFDFVLKIYNEVKEEKRLARNKKARDKLKLISNNY